MNHAGEQVIGTNKHHLNDLFFVACALKLQVHMVIFCLLFIIPLRRHTELWDDFSLLLVSQKVLPRRDLEAGVGHSNAGGRTSPGFMAKTEWFLLSLAFGGVQKEVFSPDPGEGRAPEPLVNVMGLPATSALGIGVKLRICRHTRLRCPGLVGTRSQRGPAELANEPTTLKPTCWKPQMLVGWVSQHHLQQTHVTKHANLPGSKEVWRAGHQVEGEDCLAAFAQCRPLCVLSPPSHTGNRKCPSLLQ